MADVEWQIEEPPVDASTAPPSSPRGFWPDAARLALVVVAFALLWAAERARRHLDQATARTFVAPWGPWLEFLGALALAGFAFGLAALFPRRGRYRVVPATVLAAVPFLIMAHVTLTIGPPMRYTGQHLQFLDRILGNFELVFGLNVVPVLFGVALAAGFEPRA